MENALTYFNPWWTKDYSPPGMPRQVYLEKVEEALDKSKVVVLSGLRRVGKTTILRQLASRWVERVGGKKVFYASLDHPDINRVSLMDLLAAFRRMNRVNSDSEQLLLLDEVQHRKGFELELKALHDFEDGLKVVASGSSSLVVRHRSPAMTGRYRSIAVRPLSFREFLEFTGNAYDPSQPQVMESLAEEYMMTGGLPEYVLDRDPEHLLHVVDDIILKDVAIEYELRDALLLRELFFMLMVRVGRPLSYAKMGRLVDLGPDAARKYVNYLQETFLVRLVERQGSPNVRRRSPRKCYCSDNGIRVVTAGAAGKGALAENLVFLTLDGIGEVRYVSEGRTEVDFHVGDLLLEVKYKDSLDEEDAENLARARIRGVRRKVIITRSESGDARVPKGIFVVPLWRFLADGLGSLE